MNRRLLVGAGIMALIAASCAVPTSVKSGAGSVADGAINFAKEGVGIRERSAAREIILDLNPDATSLPLMMSMVEPVITDAADDGAYVEIWVVTGGVAASMAPVDLEAANDGDLFPTGKNSAAWEREALENTEAVLAAIRIAVTENGRDGTGADLFGALAIAAERATDLPGSGTPEVILISNGIHRTPDVDLQRIDFSETDPADVASSVEPVDAPVHLTIVGAGRFPKVNPPPDASWSAGIRATWEAWCDAADTESCSVRDRATRKG